MALRQIKFVSVYQDGAEHETVQIVDVDSYIEDELEEQLFAYTGVGPWRSSDNAYYSAISIDGLEPKIFLEWC